MAGIVTIRLRNVKAWMTMMPAREIDHADAEQQDDESGAEDMG
jgi:hypothetical protein